LSPRVGLALGSLAAAIAAVPAALRVAAQGGSFGLGWLLLAGGSALVLAPAVALARAARPAPLTLLSTLAAASVLTAPLLLFARVLYDKTHHRPLGAATFAAAALVLLAIASFTSWRAFTWLTSTGVSARTLRLVLGGVSALAVVGSLALLSRAPAWRSSLLDAALALALAGAATALQLPAAWQGRLTRLAAPAWALLVIAGVVLSRGSIGSLVGQAAPVLSPLNGW
jgi:hypothetical protein